MKLLLSGIFLWIVLSANGQDTINKLDTNGLRQGHWIFYTKSNLDRHADTIKTEEGRFIDDHKEGAWTRYYPDGKTPKLIGEYVHNRPDGNYTKYYSTGIIKETGYFTRNTYKDTLTKYFDDGRMEYQAVYDDWGSLTYQLFPVFKKIEPGQATPPSPKVISATEEEKKRIKPISITGTPRMNGSPWYPDGNNTIYNEKDQIWVIGRFKNGQLNEGKVYVYDAEGILMQVQQFEYGVYTGRVEL